MARWEPDAGGRLQQAAMALFHERGYAAVTVAEIAERAGLTKRTFFNHFVDKREVLFAGSQAFVAGIVRRLDEADADLDPIDAAVVALARSDLDLAPYREFARFRRGLIASSPELQERDLIKTAVLTSAVTGALQRRQVPVRTAALTAQAAVTVFNTAYDDWVDDGTADLHTVMQRVLADLRQAIGLPRDG